MKKKKTVLYISAMLPARSETFVYRELFALKSLGVEIQPVSIHEPKQELNSVELVHLRNSAIKLYSSGKFRIFLDSLNSILFAPRRSFSVLFLAIFDMFHASDVKGKNKFKILLQGIASLALSRRVRELNIEHIHAHMANVPTTIAMYTAKHLSVSFSFTGHANDLFPNRSLLEEKIKRSLFVSCISKWHKEFYQSIYFKEDRFFPIIRCGIDTKKILYNPNKHNNPLKILSVGRLVSKKGFDILINAADILVNKRNVKIEVTIAGAGPEETKLHNMITSLSSNIKIDMLGDTNNDMVFKLLSENDIFVLPLRITETGDRDGIPVVLMEAMAKGCCVLTGDLVTIRELIDNNVSGFLVETENVVALVDLIEKLSLNYDLIDEISLKARKTIEQEFDLTVNAKRLIKTMKILGLNI